MNKNIILAGVVVLVIGLAIAIGVTLSGEPVAAALPDGEVIVNGDSLVPYSEGTDVFLMNEDEVETALSETNVVQAILLHLNFTPLLLNLKFSPFTLFV